MLKTVTLRLSDRDYKTLKDAAEGDNRSIANMIETLALRKLEEEAFVEDFEMEEIASNQALLRKLEKGHRDAKLKRGRLVG